MIRRLTTAAMTFLLSTGTALADRLVTPPLPLNGPLRCEVAYFGDSSNVPVSIIFTHSNGYTQTNTLKMGPNRRTAGVWYQATCNGIVPCPISMACVFQAPGVPASDLSGTAYITDKGGANIKALVEAR